MDGLDLDINNYTIKDLERFFQIASNKKYSAADIEMKEAELRQVLLSTGHIDKKFKRDLIAFLETAKDWLITVKCKTDKGPTSFQNVPKMEKYPNVPASKDPMPRLDELMQRPETPYVNTFAGEYFPGIMNPLKTRVISKCLNIDTRFRTNMTQTNSSDFLVDLPIRLQKVVSMQITALEFPVAFYGISSKYGNHYFNISATQQLVEDGEIFEENKVIIIPDGNYNASDFIDTINLYISSKDADGVSPIDPNSLFNYVNFRLDVTETGSGTARVIIETAGNLDYTIKSIDVDFSLDINGNPDKTPVTSKIGMNLGFLKRKYQGNTKYTSETLVEPATIRYLYLAIDDFNNNVNNHFISAFNNSILSPNILARISIKGSYFSLMMESDLNLTTEPRKYFGPVDIQKLHIQVYDDHGRILDTNNSNFSFCLLFKMLYDL